ncbi:MAG: glycosyltransferase [Desulfovibrio sp.]|jgi:glycosyltransferase involved in cell wall biosynthesis|nr:glycosyltransferase [Desulfovibrio sp.]
MAPFLSLVTYSYNDHDFVLELLRHGQNFIRPDEIIVVDDGSDPPFPPMERVKVLRSPQNLGPAGAKRLGLGEARGEVVLSIDGDIRMDRRWLAAALPLLTDPKIALVGASVIPSLADNYLSRALYRTSRRCGKNRRTFFLPGGLWLFRKGIWEHLDGLAGHEGWSHEDVWFCAKASAAGYTLVAADLYPVYEKRQIHRLQYWRRSAAYILSIQKVGEAQKYRLVSAWRESLRKQDERAASLLRGFLQTALDYGRSSGEWAFLYIELGKCLALIAEALRPSGEDSEQPPPSQENALGRALALFREYPAISALLREDLARLQLPFVPDKDAEPWPWLEEICEPVLAKNVLAELETEWIEKLRSEDAEKRFDFHYLGKR